MIMYATEEAKRLISASTRYVLWFMFQELANPTPNHCFELSIIEADGKLRQKIIHTQKNTDYQREFSFICPNPIDISVHIVGFDMSWLMLLPL